VKYRPEVDGLRAVAVISVILYHAKISIAGLNPFQGGFIGVDAFFVISGYLITSILLNNLQHQRFSFVHFYERRARRILPALYTVLFASIPFAWIIMLPKAFKEYSASLFSFILLFSNVYFWQQDSYSAEPSLLQPLLHIWSLSVEEQFYLLFPLLLLLCWRSARKHLVTLFLIGILLSWQGAIWGSTQHPDANFFLLPGRIWELVAGSLLAFLEQRKGRSSHPLLQKLCPTLGLFLILHSVFTLTDQMPHPGLVTTLPVLGVILILWYSGKKDLTTLLLSSRPFVGIGLISYSLYLWHQPIFAFVKLYTEEPTTLFQKGCIAFLIFVLSFLSWRYIEQPFRNKKQIKTSTIWKTALLSSILLTSFASYGYLSGGIPQRIPPLLREFFTDQLLTLTPLETTNGRNCFGQSIENSCKFGTSSPKTNWMLVGDSHMATLAFPLFQSLDLKQEQMTFFSGFLAPGLEQLRNNSIMYNKEFSEKLLNTLLNAPTSIVIVGGRLDVYWDGLYFDNQEGGVEPEVITTRHLLRLPGGKSSEEDRHKAIITSVQGGITRLLDAGHKVILIYPIPAVGWDLPGLFLKNYKKGNGLNLEVTTSYKAFQKQTQYAYDIYNAIPDHPNLMRFFPEHVFCNTAIPDRCITHDENSLFYLDDDHLSITGGQRIVEKLKREAKDKWNL